MDKIARRTNWFELLVGCAIGGAIALGVGAWQQDETERLLDRTVKEITDTMRSLFEIDAIFANSSEKKFAMRILQSNSLDEADEIFEQYVQSEGTEKSPKSCTNMSRIVSLHAGELGWMGYTHFIFQKTSECLGTQEWNDATSPPAGTAQ